MNSSKGKTTSAVEDTCYLDFLNVVDEPEATDDVDVETDGPWECLACSYRNENPLHLSCAICGTVREHAGATNIATAAAADANSPAGNAAATSDVATGKFSVTDGNPQASMTATVTHPSGPDIEAQKIGALDTEEGNKKSTVGQSESIPDEGNNYPMRFPAVAMAGATNDDEDRLEIIEEDDEDNAAADDYFATLEDEESPNFKKRPAAVVESEQEPVTPQSHILDPTSQSSQFSQSNPLESALPPLVRPPPQSMLPRPSEVATTTQTPSSVPMFEVEARLVEDEEDPSHPPVLDATVVRVNPVTEDRLRRNQRYLVFGIVLLLCLIVLIMGTMLASQSSRNGPSDEFIQTPTSVPIESSSTKPTDTRTDKASSSSPSTLPSKQTSKSPTERPTYLRPSTSPSVNQTDAPTVEPATTLSPSMPPTTKKTDATTVKPTTSTPSKSPTTTPSDTPTLKPTTLRPSKSPIFKPTHYPASKPTSFKGDTWIQQAKLLPNDGAEDDEFGWALSISGDTVVVGAHWDDDNGSDSGSAYVYIREGNTWKQQAKLLPNDGAEEDNFGFAVAVDGDTVVVGAHGDDDNGDASGSAYIFIREGNTWKQQAKLLANDGAADDIFGRRVSVSGNTVVVGANQDDDNGSSSGSAYVFIREGDTWKEQAKLLPNDGAAYDQFGIGVAVSGDTVVVGARYDDDNGDNSGSAYTFSLQS